MISKTSVEQSIHHLTHQLDNLHRLKMKAKASIVTITCLLASEVIAFVPFSLSRHKCKSIEASSRKTSRKSKRRCWFTSSSCSAKARSDDESKDKIAKKAALEGVLQKIEKSYGRGSIVKLGDADNMRIDCISSGALTLGEFETV